MRLEKRNIEVGKRGIKRKRDGEMRKCGKEEPHIRLMETFLNCSFSCPDECFSRWLWSVFFFKIFLVFLKPLFDYVNTQRLNRYFQINLFAFSFMKIKEHHFH